MAVSYGGRWDIAEAARKLAKRVAGGSLRADDITEDDVSAALELSGVPDPDLLIRTGGEMRISNFLLWNLAYTELYFTDKLWPEFDETAFEAALEFFAARERRFGLTGNQKAAAALKNRADRSADPSKPAPAVTAKITGTASGDVITVDSIELP